MNVYPCGFSVCDGSLDAQIIDFDSFNGAVVAGFWSTYGCRPLIEMNTSVFFSQAI